MSSEGSGLIKTKPVISEDELKARYGYVEY